MSTKYQNKQAALFTITAASNEIYTPEADAQIRAFTVHNPTLSPISLTISIGSKQLITKVITASATDVMSAIFNQQIKKGEALSISGAGLNVMLTVVEITE